MRISGFVVLPDMIKQLENYQQIGTVAERAMAVSTLKKVLSKAESLMTENKLNELVLDVVICNSNSEHPQGFNGFSSQAETYVCTSDPARTGLVLLLREPKTNRPLHSVNLVISTSLRNDIFGTESFNLTITPDKPAGQEQSESQESETSSSGEIKNEEVEVKDESGPETEKLTEEPKKEVSKPVEQPKIPLTPVAKPATTFSIGNNKQSKK